MTDTAIHVCGQLAWRVLGLELLVALSPCFQARVGAATQEDARRFIHVPHEAYLEWFRGLERPAAIISGNQFSMSRNGLNFPRPTESRLELVLTDFDRYPKSRKDSFYDFATFAGGVMADLAELQETDTNLCIDELMTPDGPGFTHPKLQVDEATNYWAIEINITVANPKQ